MQHTETHTEVKKTATLESKVEFFFVAMGVIAVTYGILFLVDFLPEKPTTDDMEPAPTTEAIQTPDAPVDPLPITLIFDTLDNRELTIENPQTRDVTELNNVIRNAVARHPDSADFEDEGTIFLFGHSTYLPNISNPYFKAFNDIQKLEWGDTIRLRSKDREYTYSVDRVYEVRATEAEIAIERGSPKLVLSTCNTFGAKDDRFVVEATLIESRPLPAPTQPEGTSQENQAGNRSVII